MLRLAVSKFIFSGSYKQINYWYSPALFFKLLKSEIAIFDAMQLLNDSSFLKENTTLLSPALNREIIVDFYLPTVVEEPASLRLLLINDGQNMEEMGFASILRELSGSIHPLLCVAIHAGTERKMEYGVAGQPDYLGRGARAANYARFILEELLPFIRNNYKIPSFREMAFAGFSLGGLTALDIAWTHPELFSKVGVFSGSLWWRSIDQSEKTYDDHQHRIMHQVIKSGTYHPGQRFFFQTGNMDETHDRNNNGIIDSIDDTLDLIQELVSKGYDREKDIVYYELADGLHDVATWGRAMPVFLQWGWGIEEGKR